jgi:hypothetical protein
MLPKINYGMIKVNLPIGEFLMETLKMRDFLENTGTLQNKLNLKFHLTDPKRRGELFQNCFFCWLLLVNSFM